MSGTGMTRLIDRMQEENLLRRLRSASDRRVNLVEITEHGRAAHARAELVYAQVIAETFTRSLEPADYGPFVSRAR